MTPAQPLKDQAFRLEQALRVEGMNFLDETVNRSICITPWRCSHEEDSAALCMSNRISDRCELDI